MREVRLRFCAHARTKWKKAVIASALQNIEREKNKTKNHTKTSSSPNNDDINIHVKMQKTQMQAQQMQQNEMHNKCRAMKF